MPSPAAISTPRSSNRCGFAFSFNHSRGMVFSVGLTGFLPHRSIPRMTKPFPGTPIGAPDQVLIDTARILIEQRYKENRHHIASAVRGASGRVYTGLHLDTYVGRASVCAE